MLDTAFPLLACTAPTSPLKYISTLRLSFPVQGLEFFPAETELNLSFKSRYPSRAPPEAYARLILDVLRGE